jgi:flagellar basal-body rod protein FlgC
MINTLNGINTTSAALEAERVRMEVISQNIANAELARDVDGKPYQRQQVVFEKVLNQQLAGDDAETLVARVEKDPRPPRLVFNPTSQNADANGMVAMPDIQVHEEMADLLVASRAFEANLAVVRNARTMALQTLSIGKR